MWQSILIPTPTLVGVPREYHNFSPLKGITKGVFPGYIPTEALFTYSRDGRCEAPAGLEVTQTVILHGTDPLFTLFDSLVTEIRLARGYSRGILRGIPPRSQRHWFETPGYPRRYSRGYSRGMPTRVGV